MLPFFYYIVNRDDETQSIYTNSLEITNTIINDLEDRQTLSHIALSKIVPICCVRKYIRCI